VSDPEAKPRASPWQRVLFLATPWLLLVGICGWCAFGYRIGCAWVHRTTDAVRLHAACQRVLVERRPAVGAPPESYLDLNDEIPPTLREWQPEWVRVFNDRVDVQLGGTIGGGFGFISGPTDGMVAGTEVIDGLRWYCSD
jgi:hypothetical protein